MCKHLYSSPWQQVKMLQSNTEWGTGAQCSLKGSYKATRHGTLPLGCQSLLCKVMWHVLYWNVSSLLSTGIDIPQQIWDTIVRSERALRWLTSHVTVMWTFCCHTNSAYQKWAELDTTPDARHAQVPIETVARQIKSLKVSQHGCIKHANSHIFVWSCHSWERSVHQVDH